MTKALLLKWSILSILLLISAHVLADNSCEFAFDGTCDEPDLCAPGTDTADCSDSGDIYQLAQRIQYEVDLSTLNDPYDVFSDLNNTEYSLLICGNYIPSLTGGNSPVPQTTMFQRCQAMGGCECDIQQNSYQALAMKRNADASIETLTWFEDGAVYDKRSKV